MANKEGQGFFLERPSLSILFCGFIKNLFEKVENTELGIQVSDKHKAAG